MASANVTPVHPPIQGLRERQSGVPLAHKSVHPLLSGDCIGALRSRDSSSSGWRATRERVPPLCDHPSSESWSTNVGPSNSGRHRHVTGLLYVPALRAEQASSEVADHHIAIGVARLRCVKKWIDSIVPSGAFGPAAYAVCRLTQVASPQLRLNRYSALWESQPKTSCTWQPSRARPGSAGLGTTPFASLNEPADSLRRAAFS